MRCDKILKVRRTLMKYGGEQFRGSFDDGNNRRSSMMMDDVDYGFEERGPEPDRVPRELVCRKSDGKLVLGNKMIQ